jgi:hypothetical protein
MTLKLPRYVIAKQLASGMTGFYFTIPTRYRKMGCTVPNEPLGNDYATACGPDGKGGRAATLNGLFDEWWKPKNGEPIESIARYGTVDWLFREYKASKGYLERVSERSRPDYERTMLLLADLRTRRGDRVGDRSVKSITPRAPTSSMNVSFKAPMACGSAKAKRSSSCAAERGQLFIGSIRTRSTRMCLTRG